MKNLITLLALTLSFFLIGCESPTGSSPETDPNVENPTDTVNVPVDTAFVPEPAEPSSSEVMDSSSSSEVTQPMVKGVECLVDGSRDCSNAVFPAGTTIEGYDLDGYTFENLSAVGSIWYSNSMESVNFDGADVTNSVFSLGDTYKVSFRNAIYTGIEFCNNWNTERTACAD